MAIAIGWCGGLAIGTALGMAGAFLAVFYAVSRAVVGQQPAVARGKRATRG